MPPRAGPSALFAVALLASAPAACDSSAGSAARSPFVAVGVGDGMPRYVQARRPTFCDGLTQAAIVDFEGTPPVPAWACLPACPPGQEYVTDVVVRAHDVQGRPTSSVEPRCTPECAPPAARTSWISFEGSRTCGASADVLGASARDAERERLASARADLARDRVDELARCLGPLKAVRTWTAGTLAAFHRCSPEAQAVEGDVEATGACVPGDDGCAARQRVLRDLADLRALDIQAVRDLGYHRGSTRAERLARCKEGCASTRDGCLEDCALLPAGACPACGEQGASCEASCERREAR